MNTASKVYRGIGITLAVLAGLGLVISSMPLTLFTPQTSPPDIFQSDSPVKFQFEVVDTPEDREQGLSGRVQVPPNYGMLFVFPEPGSYGIWMKDMLVPIDVVWIDEKGVMVGVSENLQPDSYPESFYPPSPILYALETRPGEYQVQGWEIGSTIPLP